MAPRPEALKSLLSGGDRRSVAQSKRADDPALMPLVDRHLGAFERSGSKALATRARNIRSRLAAEH